MASCVRRNPSCRVGDKSTFIQTFQYKPSLQQAAASTSVPHRAAAMHDAAVSWVSANSGVQSKAPGPRGNLGIYYHPP